MSQGKPAERILSEVTRVGSSLAELATKELDVVLKDLSGPQGGTEKLPDADIGAGRVNVGTLAFNTLQLLSKVGDLMSQLAKYDLVRNDVPQITLQSTSPLSEVTVQTDEAQEFKFLLGNDGTEDVKVEFSVVLRNLETDQVRELDVTPKLDRQLHPGERVRLGVEIPALAQPRQAAGKHALTIEVRDPKHLDKPIARKTLLIKVLPAPKPHGP
jgi:hypothetical protein